MSLRMARRGRMRAATAKWSWTAFPATSITGSGSGTFTIVSPTGDSSQGILDLMMGYNGNGPEPPSWGQRSVSPNVSGVYTWTESSPGGAFHVDSADFVSRLTGTPIVATWRADASSATVTP